MKKLTWQLWIQGMIIQYYFMNYLNEVLSLIPYKRPKGRKGAGGSSNILYFQNIDSNILNFMIIMFVQIKSLNL